MKNKPVAAALALAAVVIAASLLGSCFSPWQGDTTISLSLGTDTNSRAVEDTIINACTYSIWLCEPGAPEIGTASPHHTSGQGESHIHFDVFPGKYKIFVQAYENGDGEKLYAEGSSDGDVVVVAGKNNSFTIKMTLMGDKVTITFVVSLDNEDNFEKKFDRGSTINLPTNVKSANDFFPNTQWPGNAVHYLYKEPVSEYNGYVLAGWYKDATHDTLWNTEKDTADVDTTLYARWKDENNCAIVYDDHGSDNFETAINFVNANAEIDESYTLIMGKDESITSPPPPAEKTGSFALIVQSNNSEKRTLTLSASGTSLVYNLGARIDLKLEPTINLKLSGKASVQSLTLIAADKNTRPGVSADNWTGKIGSTLNEQGLHLAGDGSLGDVRGRWNDQLIITGSSLSPAQIVLGDFISLATASPSYEPKPISDTHGFKIESDGLRLWPLAAISLGQWKDREIQYMKGNDYIPFNSGDVPAILKGATLNVQYVPYQQSSNIEWRMWGVPIGGTKDKPKISIDTTGYAVATYQLTVIETITVDGVLIPYSADMSFNVTQQ